MKNLRIAIWTLFLLGCSLLQAQTTADYTAPDDIALRIQKLEAMEAQHTTAIQQAEKGLEQKFTDLKSTVDSNWMTLLISILGVAGGVATAFGLFWVSYRKTRDYVENKVKTQVVAELEPKLLQELGQQFTQQIIALTKNKANTLESAADDAGQRLRLKQDKQIVVLSPNMASGEAVKNVLDREGFQKVDIFILKEPGKMPSADLYVFDRHQEKPRQGWGPLEEAHLIDMHDNDQSGAGFLFFINPNDKLNGIVDRKRHSFANFEATLPQRALELLKNHPFNL